MKLNENNIRQIVESSLSKIVDRDYYNGYVFGRYLRERIINEYREKTEKRHGKLINEDKELINEVKILSEKKINHIINLIDTNRIDEVAGLVVPMAKAAASMAPWELVNGIGQGTGSFGGNLKKYYSDRNQNRKNYIQNGKIVDYDENGNPIYDNKGSKFWRGVKSGLATAAPWIGGALGGIGGGGIGSAALGTAGYFAGEQLGKNFNGSTQIMSKDLRNKMKADAKAFKAAKKAGQPYTSPYMSRGINNPYIDQYDYQQLNGAQEQGYQGDSYGYDDYGYDDYGYGNENYNDYGYGNDYQMNYQPQPQYTQTQKYNYPWD